MRHRAIDLLFVAHILLCILSQDKESRPRQYIHAKYKNGDYLHTMHWRININSRRHSPFWIFLRLMEGTHFHDDSTLIELSGKGERVAKRDEEIGIKI